MSGSHNPTEEEVHKRFMAQFGTWTTGDHAGIRPHLHDNDREFLCSLDPHTHTASFTCVPLNMHSAVYGGDSHRHNGGPSTTPSHPDPTSTVATGSHHISREHPVPLICHSDRENSDPRHAVFDSCRADRGPIRDSPHDGEMRIGLSPGGILIDPLHGIHAIVHDNAHHLQQTLTPAPLDPSISAPAHHSIWNAVTLL